MLSSSLKTGSTDLRDTLVQQPNTAETLSLLMSSRAFSAKSGQFEAGSTTTGSSFLPSTPPLAFCSAMSMSIASFRVVSEIAIVPESECRMPTLMVSSARAAPVASALRLSPAARAAAELQVFQAITVYPFWSARDEAAFAMRMPVFWAVQVCLRAW